MDVQTPLICAGVVAVTSAVVYLSSVFGIRERTYEEAIEEQRRKNSLDISLKNNKNEKTKKEKKEKKKEKPNKKEKSRDKHISESKSVTNVSPPPNESTTIRKTEHAVGFKAEPEVLLLSEESENVEISVQPKSSYDKPIKPILMNKSDQNLVQNQFLKQSVNGSGQRNSFDHILPKDELELLKDAKKAMDREVFETIADQTVLKSSDDHLLMSSVIAPKDSTPSPLETDLNQTSEPEFQKTENIENSSPIRRTKRSKQSLIEGNTKEVSVKTIIDLVKTVTLNNEEIQHLTDILLNKQSDGSTEWRKKNDPLAVLKKQLQEKEVALEKALENLSAAVQKTRELRNELDLEKSGQHNTREKSQQMQIEIQSLHIKLQQTYENQRSELNAMQKQLQQMQVKCNEERSHAIRLQEDNTRLQQLVKNEQHLKHEIEQLRKDRQQYELRIAATQKSNEDFIRQTQQMDNRLKTMSDSRQKDESSFQKHMQDVSQELQKSETHRNALVEELNHKSNKCNSLETENIQIKSRLKDFEDSKNGEINILIDQISELNKQKQIIENALIEAKSEQIGDQNNERQELLKINEQLFGTKEELKSLKSSFEVQINVNKELTENNRLATEMIEKLEKEKTECIQNAVKISEQLNNELKNKSQELRQQTEINITNESLTNKLSEGLESTNHKLESIKKELTFIIPGLDTQSDDWISKIQISFNEKLNSNVESSDTELKIRELQTLLNIEREKSNEFQTKATQFASALSETESILSKLQNKIESQETNFKTREQEFETELKTHSDENNKLRDEIKTLKSSLVQIQEFKETIADMEHKLKELQSKLSGEENEKRILEQKYDEVSKRQATKAANNLSQELNEKTKEMESFETEKSEIDRIKYESEELKAQLEKERKLSKDLNLQNVRLNSLVKIGHESLKMEEDKVKQLEAQLNLKNGSPSPVNCSTNGSPETIGNNNCSNVNSSDNSEELSTNNTTQTQTPLLSNSTNNKTNKSKRTAASVKTNSSH